MNKPFFSVIIPTYNRENFISNTIKSVFNQTYTDFEVIVIDDHSTDKTKEKISSQIVKNDIIYLENKENYGVSYSRNRGIKIARGQYIAFLDSDDYWKPKKLESQYEFFQQNPEIKICHTNEIWFRNGVHLNQKKIHQKQGGLFFKRALERCLVSPSSVAIHHSIFKEYGFFDEKLLACEDYDLWLRLNNTEYFGYIDETLIIKNGGHEDQLSMNTKNLDYYRILSLIKLLKQNQLSDDNYDLAYKMCKKKLTILKSGALKHQNKMLLNFCNNISSDMGFDL